MSSIFQVLKEWNYQFITLHLAKISYENCAMLSHSVMSDSLWPHGLFSSSVRWDSPGTNTGVGCYFLLQGIFLTQESNPGLLHCRQLLYQLSKIGASTKKERHFPTSLLFAQMHEGQSTWEGHVLHVSREATSSISTTQSPLNRWSGPKSRREELPVETSLAQKP